MLQYPKDILHAFGETITGDDEKLMWLFNNGYPELAALSRSIRGSEEAFKFLLKHYPHLAALDAAIDNNPKAYLWLKEHKLLFSIIFADACRNKAEAIKWLQDRKQDIFLMLAAKIDHFRETQYFNIYKKHF
ncbi:MAG: hypothetical protein HPY80_05250 [Bacteroidales bacterium]|jgi:hypothetical protein|nr:hypothetical protein [Bacteroidales bacterium]NPV36059.1 hypothetical protein [Bacteroidales bacterium]